jgi:hypothetical protein
LARIESGLALRWSQIKRLAGHRYRRSVFRRTVLLLALLVPAYCANLAVMYFAADLLSVEQFGLFYVANTLGNILFSGSFILNMFLTRHLVSLVQIAGEAATFTRMRQVERMVVLWGAVIAGVIFVAMLSISSRLGVQSYLVVLFVVLDAYTAYVAELGRVMLQSLRHTLLLGSYTLLWMVLRFLLCIAGILTFGTVWGALGGVVAAAVVVYGGFHVWVTRNAAGMRAAAAPLLPLATLIPAVLGYGLSIVVSNLDIVLGYLLLSQTELGVYSASSIFPKAMLVVTTPLLQMLFPMMVGGEQSRLERLVVLGKIGMAMLALASAGAALVWQLSPWVCGGAWGMPLCDRSLLHILLLSVVPLVLLRLLVLHGFSRGRDWFAAWLTLPTLVYLWIAMNSAPGNTAMAEQFTLFSAVAFAFFFMITIIAPRSRIYQPT